MKLEIEVTEEQIKSAIERQVRVAIAEYSKAYWNEQGIKDAIKKYWQETVEKVVLEELSNSTAIRAKVQTAMENKMKAQLTAMLKVK